MEDPLQKLVVDATELDRELLATVLSNLIRIDKITGEIRFTPKSAALPKKFQVLAYLMGRKATKALGLVGEEAVSPKELGTKLGIGGGPLRGQLSLFKKERLLDVQNGKYYVPNYAIEQVKASLEHAGSKEK